VSDFPPGGKKDLWPEHWTRGKRKSSSFMSVNGKEKQLIKYLGKREGGEGFQVSVKSRGKRNVYVKMGVLVTLSK